MFDEHRPFFPFFDPDHLQGPPLPMRRKKFRELKHFFILMYAKDTQKGITGYQLQENYNLPRGTAVRILNELEESSYLDTNEEIIDGRAHKFYSLTEKGVKYLETLKEKWATRFAMLSKIIPPERFGSPFLHKTPMKFLIKKIKEFSSKEEVLEFFHGMQFHMQKHKEHLLQRVKFIEMTKQVIDHIIEDIEAMDTFNFEKIKALITEGHQKLSEQLYNEFNFEKGQD